MAYHRVQYSSDRAPRDASDSAEKMNLANFCVVHLFEAGLTDLTLNGNKKYG